MNVIQKLSNTLSNTSQVTGQTKNFGVTPTWILEGARIPQDPQ